MEASTHKAEELGLSERGLLVAHAVFKSFVMILDFGGIFIRASTYFQIVCNCSMLAKDLSDSCSLYTSILLGERLGEFILVHQRGAGMFEKFVTATVLD